MSEQVGDQGHSARPTAEDERRRRVGAMLANFAQEGMHPDAEHMALLERYVKGSAQLSDLLEHARQYAITAQLRDRDDAVRASRATVVLEGGKISPAAEENAVRYVLGEIGVEEFVALNLALGTQASDKT